MQRPPSGEAGFLAGPHVRRSVTGGVTPGKTEAALLSAAQTLAKLSELKKGSPNT